MRIWLEEIVRTMERHGRATTEGGSQSDPSPEWTGTGPETGLGGIAFSKFLGLLDSNVAYFEELI